MKYNSLKPSAVKSFRLPTLNGGTGLGNDADNNALCGGKNVWFKDGTLKTRSGLFAASKNAVTVETKSQTDEISYILTDTCVNRWGIEYRIGYSNVMTENFMYVTNVYLVSSDINIKSIGSLTFLRFSSDEFKIPENIVFYTGTPQSGGGIFALVTLYNVENYNDKNYNIYEINDEFTEWVRVYDYYVPTVLINGRGNNYDMAHNEAFITLPAEKALESQNILNGKFYAYYTSDGYSNMFRLPLCDLSGDNVTCRIYYTSSLYVEWSVSGVVIADTKSFMGFDIMLEVDREKGTLSFFNNGQPYPIPVISTYNENNIKVTATKETENGFSQVVHSTCSLTADGRVYLAGGQNGNVLMLAKCENPFYFPQRSTVNVGGYEEIIALSIQSKKNIALKSNETYYVSLRKGDIINEIGLIADNDTLFKTADTLSCELISKSIGCGFKNTVCKVNGKTDWLGGDCKVYLLNSIGFDDIIDLSKGANTYGYDYEEAFAVSDGQYYILIAGKDALACELSEASKPKWYFWEFDSGITLGSGFYKNRTLYFLCFSGNSGFFYVSKFSGDFDTKLYYDADGNIQSQNVNVDSFIETKAYALSGLTQKNTIESIYLALSGKGRVEIKVNGRHIAFVDLRFSTDDYDKGEYKTVMLTPHLYDTERVKIEVLSSDAFALKDIEIFYRKTG